MRKIFLTLSLSLALTASSFAGDIPISGVAGCAPGLWYPESQVCVLDLSAPVPTGKEQPTFMDDMLVTVLLKIRTIF